MTLTSVINFCFSPDVLVQSGFWFAQLFYFFCFVPQIVANMRHKSGTGVSELLLIGYLNAYLFLLFYIFCMDLPLAYKVLVPLQTVATLILIIQRLYYDRSEGVKRLRIMYALNVGVFLLAIPVALKNPYMLGAVFGWLTFTFSLFNQLPQVFKIHRTKSVVGFSYFFVLFTGVAAVCETIVAFMAHLPLQTCFCALRGVALFVIFTLQFLLYRSMSRA